MAAKSQREPQRTRRSSCPISVALEILGDAWSLLIVRDLMFKQVDSFNGFLAADEKIASNVLSDRLARLEACGLIAKRRDPRDGRRFRYRLTRKGVELAPALVELVMWSARHHKTDAPKSVIAAMRRDPRAFSEDVMAAWRSEEDETPPR